MGLSITKAEIELLGGSIQVKSNSMKAQRLLLRRWGGSIVSRRLSTSSFLLAHTAQAKTCRRILIRGQHVAGSMGRGAVHVP